jgi:uncharacterized protein with NRDE domain
MCLIAFATGTREHRLVLAANRDELHARPTLPAAWWIDTPTIFGGRDVEKGGSWLAARRGARLAAVTNVRVGLGGAARAGARSRGELCSAFVRDDADAAAYAARVMSEAHLYGPFNLLVWSGAALAYASSHDLAAARVVDPGVHAVSNASLDTPWPKVVRATAAMREALTLPAPRAREHLFAMLAERGEAPDEALPSTGVPHVVEKALSAIFIAGPVYGTRASTVVTWTHDDEVVFEERSFGPGGVPLGVARGRWRARDAESMTRRS